MLDELTKLVVSENSEDLTSIRKLGVHDIRRRNSFKYHL